MKLDTNKKKDELLSTRRPSSSGRKCCRELKGLVSSVNYEAKASREAKGKDKVQGGGGILWCINECADSHLECRGLNDLGKRIRIKHMLKIWKPDIIYFQESKLKLITNAIV